MEKQREFSGVEAFFYSLGAIGLQLSSVIFTQFIIMFYHPPNGEGLVYMPLGLATFIMTFAVINDAISDPLVGYWSDRTRHKMGRRRPYIVYGSIPLLLVFVALWFPPINSSSVINFVWGMFFAALYYWLFTIVIIPYFALLPEIATNDSERIRLATWQSWGMLIGLAIAFSAGMIITKIGYVKTAIFFGTAGTLLLLLSGLNVRERFHERKSVPVSSYKELVKQFTNTLKNKPFLIYLAAITTFNIGFYTVQISLPYFAVVIIGKTTEVVSQYLIFGFFPMCCLSFVLIPQIAKVINKKYIFLFGIIFMALMFPFIGFIGNIKDLSLRFYIGFVVFGLAGLPQGILYIMQGPILGEIIDFDEQYTGERREAIYNGALGFAMKAGYSFSSMIMWGLFRTFGYSKEQPLGILLLGPACAVISLLALIVFAFYPKNLINKKTLGSSNIT